MLFNEKNRITSGTSFYFQGNCSRNLNINIIEQFLFHSSVQEMLCDRTHWNIICSWTVIEYTAHSGLSAQIADAFRSTPLYMHFLHLKVIYANWPSTCSKLSDFQEPKKTVTIPENECGPVTVWSFG